MSAEKAQIAEQKPVEKETPCKQYPRTRNVTGDKMSTFRNGKLLSVKKTKQPTPFKHSTKKEHIKARESAQAINANKIRKSGF
ncbi:hypothetical protein B9Z55_025473 [Caenorhabditis nigoni]|uniref:Uncharacterized protein n=1 Tax=Caenorhabditis nigoni TaxID=1611254 RepID=A0A2G5SZB9_9PELO|nr:hypothetical protein B9Z55_025473 [Caenorhabditis nigoni]